MYDVRITAIRKADYKDLQEKYENPILHTCDLKEGQTFVSVRAKKPDALCPEAWKIMQPYVKALSKGKGNFFDGWMQNKYSAMISCNDGFRPVSFYLEKIESDN